MFDPSTGRWFEEDPLGFTPRDPNLFRYVHNSPTNATDPSGLADKPTEILFPHKERNRGDSDYRFILNQRADSEVKIRKWTGLKNKSDLVEGTFKVYANVDFDELDDKGKRTAGKKGGILFEYRGTGYKSVQFIQVFYTYALIEMEVKNGPVAFCPPLKVQSLASGLVTFSEDPNNPIWHADADPETDKKIVKIEPKWEMHPKLKGIAGYLPDPKAGAGPGSTHLEPLTR